MNDINLETILETVPDKVVCYGNNVAFANDIGALSLFDNPTRLSALSILICYSGTIECSINLSHYVLTQNSILVILSGDIVHVEKAENVKGIAMILSTDFLNRLNIDFSRRSYSYMNLKEMPLFKVPEQELIELQPYFPLLTDNITRGNESVIRGLVSAFTHTIILLIEKYQPVKPHLTERATRAQLIFNDFMKLLYTYHASERCLGSVENQWGLIPKKIRTLPYGKFTVGDVGTGSATLRDTRIF